MTTIDLSTPRPPPSGLLDSLPRRVALTLRELQFVAQRAGDAPLPFDLLPAGDASLLDGRLGQSQGVAEDDAYARTRSALRDPADSLTRRHLMVGDRVEDGMLGAVGLLATPTVALDLDLRVGQVQAKAWHRQAADAVATLSTVDGIVFELAWFPTSSWSAELARVAVIPEDITSRRSAVPDQIDLPYTLADAAAEALRCSRADLLPVLAAQHSGQVIDADGRPIPDAEVVALLAAFTAESQGRLRGLVADVATETTTVVGVVSWTLLADGWHALRPHMEGDSHRVEIRRVDAAELPVDLAPVLAEVTR